MKKIVTAGILALGLSFGAIAEDDKPAKDFYVSVGFGANYGLLGATVNKKIDDKVEVFAGVGYLHNKGYVIGGRYHIKDNIRLIANYGTNSTLERSTSLSSSEYESFEGFNLGADYLFNNGWSVGLMLRDTSKLDDKEDELKKLGYSKITDSESSKIVLSVGYDF